MQLLPEIEQRRSIRSYTEAPVQRDVLQRIVDAGRLAPSAKNRQAWRFVVVTQSEIRAKLQAAAFGQDYVGSAGAVIALCTTNIEYTMPNGIASYPVDLGIAGAFMMLQAEHERLGSCMVTTFREEEVKALLTVPHRMRVVMLLAVGHPAERPEPAHRHAANRVIGWEHW